MMATGVGPVSEHHVSGLYVTMLMDNLATSLSPEAIGGVLSRAGETRSLEELGAASSWSSYDEFKRLLQEAKRTLDSLPNAERRSPTPKVKLESELAGTIQAFGSPASILAANTGTNPLVPIRRYETTEVGPNEWTIREWFVEGFEPFPEFCEFVAQQYAMVPLFFGLPEGEVTEEKCQCRGDEACLFRLRWAQIDEVAARAEYFEARAQQLESRLEQLQDMITDLASNERYEDILQGIVASTMATVVVQRRHSCPRTPPGSPPADLLQSASAMTRSRTRSPTIFWKAASGAKDRPSAEVTSGSSALRRARHRRARQPVHLPVAEIRWRPTPGWPPPPSTPPMLSKKPGIRPCRRRSCCICPHRWRRSSVPRRWRRRSSGPSPMSSTATG